MVAFSQPPVSSEHDQFEVASVRLNPTPGGEAYVQVVPGRLRMRNVPARTLIQLACEAEAYQISGGPSWIATDRFDIEAEAEGNPSTQRMQGPMLLALLQDRFRLAVHREKRQMSVYEVRLSSEHGKMQPSSAGTCIPYRPDAPPPSLTAPGQPRPNYCDYPHLGRRGRNRTLDGKGISIADLTNTLARVELHRPVIDRTNLTGTFDIHLEWTPGLAAAPENPERSDDLSIFTALRDELGLRLDSSRALSEVIVVDRIEKPAVN